MYKPLLMMRIRGLKGPFFHKVANLNNNLARSVGNFLSISDEDDGGVDPPPVISNPVFNIGNLGLVFDAAAGWLSNTRSSTATIEQADGVVSDCFVEEIRYSDARRFSPYIFSNPVDYQSITLPPGDYIYSARGIGDVVTSKGTITCTNNRVQLKFTMVANTAFTIEPDAGILFNQLENDNAIGVASEEFTVELDQTSGLTFGIPNNTDNTPLTSNISVNLSSGGSTWEIDNGDIITTKDLSYQFNNKINSFRWSGDQSTITQFNCSVNEIIGPVPDFSAAVNLATLYCHINKMTGSIPDLSTNVNLKSIYFHTNQLSGSIPNLSSNVKLIDVYFYANQLSGSIPNLSTNVDLNNFQCYVNKLTGSIPDLSANSKLTKAYFSTNQLTGSIPDLSSNVILVEFLCNGNQLTGYIGGGMPATLAIFNASNNAIVESAINQILIDYDNTGRVTGSMVLNGGTNAAPTGAGITAKDNLIARGVTVTTN